MSLREDVEELNFCLWLGERYSEDITQGETTRDVRKQRARELIRRRGEASLPLKNHATGETKTIAEVFERVYGEQLLPVERHENGDGV